ncbi:hypothetical protein DFH07DRAFT_94579 [Mycena maculata]|uniref:Uncharacterized protein n=1 Tax=Mycena maculata TaxID=230809 RepID=A0AAD7MZC4_9AGAR|nr:hypothetical protein DFH07DRAFT_94579 [Mycena maculata]
MFEISALSSSRRDLRSRVTPPTTKCISSQQEHNGPAPASFHVRSLSLSSAHPHGASVVTVPPELLVKSGSVAATTAAWASFYAAFPFLKVVQMVPGTSTWGTWALNRAYKLAGGEQTAAELKERYSVYRNPPLGRWVYGLHTIWNRTRSWVKGGIYFTRDRE